MTQAVASASPMFAPVPTDDHWTDIAPPDVPAQSVEPLLLVGGAMLLALLILLALRWFRGPRGRSRRALRRLAGIPPRAGSATRAGAIAVRQCLRDGLGQRRLEALQVEADDQHRWQSFLGRLSACCFSARAPNAAEVQDIAREALSWLERNPAPR